LPEVPKVGIDVEADAWNGLIVPVREKLGAQLMEPVGSSPEDLRARMDGEIARWTPVRRT
jgi:hypothetical protein